MEINNPMDAYWLIVVGCAIISLIWIINVSRLTQLLNKNAETLREGEDVLKLRGHKKIACMDDISPVPIILRHRHLRFIGFWVYFSLLILNLIPILLNRLSIPVGAFPLYALGGSAMAVVCSGSLTLYIRHIYYAGLPSRLEQKSHKFKRKDYLIIIGLAILLISYPAILQVVPDANVHLMHGLKYFNDDKYDEAIKAYTEAIDIEPNYAKAYALRGEAYRAKGDDGRSKADVIIANALYKAQ